MAFNLGFIGGGNMSTAIAKGILQNENHLPSKLWVAGPRLYNLQHWSDWGANVTTNSGEVILQCEVVFIGVKPGVLNEFVNDCLLTVKPSSRKVLFISMLVGITLEQLDKALQKLPIEVNVIRILPNTPMAVGAGSCLYSIDNKTTIDHCTVLENLLQGCGVVMYMVIEALADGAVKQGVPRAMALRHAAQMVAGSGQMVLQSGKHPGVLKDEVCSPGGCTICGVAALENGKLRATMINALEAATSKLNHK